ncbi:MAG: hypothetical protein Q9227_007743 [Pyrenula ochraceoflavens]
MPHHDHARLLECDLTDDDLALYVLEENGSQAIDLEGNHLPRDFEEDELEAPEHGEETGSTASLGPKRKRPDVEITSGSFSNSKRLKSAPRQLYNFKVGQDLELKDGTFHHVKLITKSGGLRGYELIRSSSEEIGHGFESHTNELVWKLTSSWNEHRSKHPCSLKTIFPEDVKRIRRITFTNKPLDAQSRELEAKGFKTRFDQEEEGKLFCRWKFLRIFRKNAPFEYAFQRLTEADIPSGPWRQADEDVRLKWRGKPSAPGGSHLSSRRNKSQIPSIDLTTGALSSKLADLRLDRQYSVGDGFAGGGGMGCGAVQAGLHLQWGVDHDKDAVSTYRQNFESLGTRVYCQDIFSFIQMAKQRGFQVDVLHLSPPCQTFSPAHTSEGQNDEANSAALLCVYELVKTLRPRQVTLEQTPGLLRLQKHRNYFNALINCLVSLECSVRWSILHTREFGVPQIRNRLFIMAAAPGEFLPEFPSPTHGPLSPFKRPFNTIGSAIINIPPDATHHDVCKAAFRNGLKAEYSAETLAYTLTTGCAENYHPDGDRRFTIRELACIQTFPLTHLFFSEDGDLASVTSAQRMIGNAVPPVMAKRIFQQVIKALKKADGLYMDEG